MTAGVILLLVGSGVVAQAVLTPFLVSRQVPDGSVAAWVDVDGPGVVEAGITAELSAGGEPISFSPTIFGATAIIPVESGGFNPVFYVDQAVEVDIAVTFVDAEGLVLDGWDSRVELEPGPGPEPTEPTPSVEPTPTTGPSPTAPTTPTAGPSPTPSLEPAPTVAPTAEPSPEPSVTPEPSPEPTELSPTEPTAGPSPTPSATPSVEPSPEPVATSDSSPDSTASPVAGPAQGGNLLPGTGAEVSLLGLLIGLLVAGSGVAVVVIGRRRVKGAGR